MTTLAQIRPEFPRIVTIGLNGMLINFSDQLSEEANRAALAFRAGLEALALPGIAETTTSLTSTFVVYDPHLLPQDRLREHLTTLLNSRDWGQTALQGHRRRWHIPAVFDGPQLAEAADLAGVECETAVEDLCEAALRVLTIGFAPGQPYLGTLKANWDIPRQSGLTKEVPRGAIVVAIRQIVLFSAPLPTGWRHVGQTAFHAFRPDQEQPFAFGPGDEVKFHAVSAKELAEIREKDLTGDGGATWEDLR